jgi:hypothetical protein
MKNQPLHIILLNWAGLLKYILIDRKKPKPLKRKQSRRKKTPPSPAMRFIQKTNRAAKFWRKVTRGL